MNRNRLLFLALVMVILNVWRWQSSEVEARVASVEKPAESRNLTALTSTIYEKPTRSVKSRDIFSFGSNDAQVAVPLLVKKNDSHRIDTGKTPAKHKVAKSRNIGSSSYNGLHLLGMLFKDKSRHAFIMENGKSYAVRVGDTFNGRTRVKAISETSVTLVNTKNNSTFILNL